MGNCGAAPSFRTDSCYGSFLGMTDGSPETTPLKRSLAGDVTRYFALVAYTTTANGVDLLFACSNEVQRSFVLETTTPPSPPIAPILLTISVVVICTTECRRGNFAIGYFCWHA